MKKCFPLLFFLALTTAAVGQIHWQNVDSVFGPLPPSVHIYFTQQPADTAPFRAFYLIADLKDNSLHFSTDTTLNRRLTPSQFHERNNRPLAVVNGTFFSFETNRNLNVVITNGKLVAYNAPVKGSGKDSARYLYPFKSAIGISKKRKADVAWLATDSTRRYPAAFSVPVRPYRKPRLNTDSVEFSDRFGDVFPRRKAMFPLFDKKWKMQTAIGGGPVLLTHGEIVITNEEERLFTGKAANDKHPRTAMGYTADNKLIILVVEGRNPRAGGATLLQEAQILKELGCVEALNLDGGGSSCLLVNGQETIRPAGEGKQRAVPAVFLISSRTEKVQTKVPEPSKPARLPTTN